METKFKATLITCAFFISIGAAFADRTDVWSANSVQVTRVELEKLTDGGCAVVAWAVYSKSDGGTASEPSRRAEVSGVNRTDCLNIIDTRAPVLFKSDKGL